jgi:hypothetical protein
MLAWVGSRLVVRCELVCHASNPREVVDLVRVVWRKRLGVDYFRQCDVEVVTDRMRATAVDYPLLAVSLDHHFPAVGKFWAPLAVDRDTPPGGRSP